MFDELPVLSNAVLIITVCVKVANSTFLVTNKRTKWAELSRYYLLQLFCNVILDCWRLTVTHDALNVALTPVLSLPSFTGNRNNIDIFLYNWRALLGLSILSPVCHSLRTSQYRLNWIKRLKMPQINCRKTCKISVCVPNISKIG